MNHKLTMHKLEEMKIKKLEEAREIQKEVVKLTAAINDHRRMYLAENKHADECNVILAGYSREEIRGTLMFTMDALKDSYGYSESYRGIDTTELLKNDAFFDFLIIAIGRPVIIELKKRFGKTKTVDGEVMIESRKGIRRSNNENFNKRLFQKCTKRVVIEEAKRIASEPNKPSEGSK